MNDKGLIENCYRQMYRGMVDKDRTILSVVLNDSFVLVHMTGMHQTKEAFTWIKLAPKENSIFGGMGYWTRANAEICLLATKGQPRRRSNNVHQVIISHVEEHSKKPDEARRRIVALLGDVPRVELFARQADPGWDVWGNEVQSTIEWGTADQSPFP